MRGSVKASTSAVAVNIRPFAPSIFSPGCKCLPQGGKGLRDNSVTSTSYICTILSVSSERKLPLRDTYCSMKLNIINAVLCAFALTECTV